MKGLKLKKWVILFICFFLSFEVHAHTFNRSSARVNLETDGQYEIHITFDLIQFLVAEDPDLYEEELNKSYQSSREEILRQLDEIKSSAFEHIEIRIDGVLVAPEEFAFKRDLKDPLEKDPFFPIGSLIVKGKYPDPGKEERISVAFSEAFVYILLFTESDFWTLEPWQESPPILIHPIEEDLNSGDNHFFQVAMRYLSLGYVHILPYGLDHILFVMGLVLLSPKWRPLLAQVTAFTVAHSMTLAFVLMEWIAAPSQIVEPLIAISIVYVAVENIFMKEQLKWYRILIVFAFGLLHGMGFAGVLMEKGFPSESLISCLLMFNIGVELGQLTVVLGMLSVLYFVLKKPWYRSRVVIPLSTIIALIGLYWTIERVL